MDWKKVEVRDEDGNGFEFIEKDGLVMLSMFQQTDPDTRLEQIKDFKHSKDDVFICSYPKTGTHWVFNLVYFLKTDGPLDGIITTFPKMMELVPSKRWKMITKSPVRASHFKPDRLPSDLLANGRKVIVVIRNPKDTCVSLLHHLLQMKTELKFGDKISWKRFYEGWVNGELPYGTYFDYYNSWAREIKVNSNLDVLIVHFEKLKSGKRFEPPSLLSTCEITVEEFGKRIEIQVDAVYRKDGLKELQRIQEFLGMKHPQDRLQQILDKCTFKNMKSDVESGKSFTPFIDENGKSILYRKGEVGDWKNYFTVAQSEYLDKVVEEKFKDNIFTI